MTTHVLAPSSSTSARDRIAMGLMLLCAIGAFIGFIGSIADAASAGSATQQVETWRALGFTLFTGLFVLLAFWPRQYPLLWELVILNKAALSIIEATLISNHAVNAASSAVIDGILTLILVAAYLLSRGYLSWRSPHSA